MRPLLSCTGNYFLKSKPKYKHKGIVISFFNYGKLVQFFFFTVPYRSNTYYYWLWHLSLYFGVSRAIQALLPLQPRLTFATYFFFSLEPLSWTHWKYHIAKSDLPNSDWLYWRVLGKCHNYEFYVLAFYSK